MIENKYASALDGLEIEDPVKSFFDFCKEREKIRISRENGEDFPWSADEIFQNGRFLNVFREDDRVSKSIIKFADNLNEEPSKLINAVFFARWCNRQEVLDTLTPDDLNNPENLKNKLESIDPWCNETAYPVEPVTWGGKQYSRIDAATKLFYEVQDSLLNILESSNKSVINATNNINKEFQMQNINQLKRVQEKLKSTHGQEVHELNDQIKTLKSQHLDQMDNLKVHFEDELETLRGRNKELQKELNVSTLNFHSSDEKIVNLTKKCDELRIQLNKESEVRVKQTSKLNYYFKFVRIVFDYFTG